MAISAEHLGSQVQCPHCRTVVQTVKPDAAPAVPQIPNMELPQPESIFSGTDTSDSAIGVVPAPRVELPPEMTDSQPLAAIAAPSTGEPAAHADFTQFKRRPVYDKSVLLLIAMIFLVPYAIVMTLFVVYLVFMRPAPVDPLEYLRDPAAAPKAGGPKRVSYEPLHDTPIAPHRRAPIGKTIDVGELQIKPTHVLLTTDQDLRLVLHAKNTSAKTFFEPLNEAYVKYTTNQPENKPFSFLESNSKNVENLYGVDLGYHKDGLARDEPVGSAVLTPGGEVTIALTTYESYRAKHVANIAKSDDTYLWRVRVRRGFVKVDGKDISATTVIGVEFSSKDIERPGKS